MKPADHTELPSVFDPASEQALNTDVVELYGGWPTDDRGLGWRLLDVIVLNAITLALIVVCFALAAIVGDI